MERKIIRVLLWISGNLPTETEQGNGAVTVVVLLTYLNCSAIEFDQDRPGRYRRCIPVKCKTLKVPLIFVLIPIGQEQKIIQGNTAEDHSPHEQLDRMQRDINPLGTEDRINCQRLLVFSDRHSFEPNTAGKSERAGLYPGGSAELFLQFGLCQSRTGKKTREVHNENDTEQDKAAALENGPQSRAKPTAQEPFNCRNLIQNVSYFKALSAISRRQ